MINKEFFKKYQTIIKWLFSHCQWIFQAEKMGHELHRNWKLLSVYPNGVTYEFPIPYYDSRRKEWRLWRETQFFGRNEYALKLQKFLWWLPAHVGYDWRTLEPIFQPAFVGLTVTTFNPDTTAVDGRVHHDAGTGSTETWATVRADAGSAAATQPGIDANFCRYYAATGNADKFRLIVRCYFLFPTGSLPDTDTISAATLSIWEHDKTTSPAGAIPSQNIYSGVPASDTVLAAGDYAQAKFGSTPFSTELAFNSVLDAAYNDFVFNADGLAAISKTGNSRFSALIANYDVANVSPPWGSAESPGWGANFSPAVNLPKLVVTHAAAAGNFLTLLGVGT